MKPTLCVVRPVFALLLALSVMRVDAHPMGNFSVSHYARIVAGEGQAEIVYALDLAEIPTFEMLQQWNLTAASPRKQLEQRAAQQMRDWARNLVLRSDGKVLRPRYESSEIVVADGAGNMPIMRITARLRVPDVTGKLEYEDNNYRDRAGWKEVVVAAGKGASIRKTSAGSEDRSQALTVYPQDSTVSPPQVLKASVEWTSDAPVKLKDAPVVAKVEPVAKPVVPQQTKPAPVATPAAAQAAGTVVRGDYLSDLLSHKEISLSMILIGIAVAFGLGAIHAFSPGHGKTMVAAYLVGSRGTFKHAAFLGGMVTFTHTISVFALAFVTLFLSQYILPERLYPILGAISGLTIVWIGATLFYKRIRKLGRHTHHHHDHVHVHSAAHSHAVPHTHDHVHAPVAHTHDHGHDQVHVHTAHTHDHHDHDHEHDHGPNGHSHLPEGEVTMGSLIALGASGGLVPCPSGLVLLLSAIAIGRIGLGIVLLVGFSAGLAVVLTSIGLLVVYAKTWLPDPQSTARNPAFRYLPVASAAVVVVLGILLTSVSLGWIQPGRLIG